MPRVLQAVPEVIMDRSGDQGIILLVVLDAPPPLMNNDRLQGKPCYHFPCNGQSASAAVKWSFMSVHHTTMYWSS